MVTELLGEKEFHSKDVVSYTEKTKNVLRNESWQMRLSNRVRPKNIKLIMTYSLTSIIYWQWELIFGFTCEHVRWLIMLVLINSSLFSITFLFIIIMNDFFLETIHWFRIDMTYSMFETKKSKSNKNLSNTNLSLFFVHQMHNRLFFLSGLWANLLLWNTIFFFSLCSGEKKQTREKYLFIDREKIQVECHCVFYRRQRNKRSSEQQTDLGKKSLLSDV